MNELPSVSVIIPTYNPIGIFLEEAVNSILNQNYKPLELIVVDDCSDQAAQKTLLALKEKYAFKLFVLEKNSGGPSKPLNKGLLEAKGKYIALCAQDDYWLPGRIQKQIDFLAKNPQLKVCYGKSLQQTGDKIIKKSQPFKNGFIFDALLLQKFCISGLTVMFYREILDEVGFYDENLRLEDLDMWLRVASNGPMGYMKDYLAVYRIHSGNTHVNNLHAILENKKLVLNKWQHTDLFQAAYKLNDFYDSIHSGFRSWFTGFFKCLPLAFDSRVGFIFFIKRSIRLLLILIKKHLQSKIIFHN